MAASVGVTRGLTYTTHPTFQDGLCHWAFAFHVATLPLAETMFLARCRCRGLIRGDDLGAVTTPVTCLTCVVAEQRRAR